MLKLPYGISNFEMLRENNYFYQDRSNFIEKLDNLPTRYHLFLRPRKFGKSLFLSMLHYYYGLEYKDKFGQLFEGLYIGNHPSTQANSYLVLSFNFSGIDTTSKEGTYKGFCANVKMGILEFIGTYKNLLGEIDENDFINDAIPERLLKKLLTIIKNQNLANKVFLLIDEYDQFANELLAFDTNRFRENVSRNGFVRKFYETLKIATGEGILARMFITGVSSITVDSLTSGFNIISNLTLNAAMHDMMGFSHEETAQLLAKCEISDTQIPELLQDLTLWYNGYLFSEDGKRRLFNPNMLLYFLLDYTATGKYPRQMLDVNIMSDYKKVRSIFNIGGQESARFGLLEQIVKDGYIDFNLTINFNLEAEFSEENFLSLLFYMGILTIREPRGSSLRFEIPNYVIRQLYFEYFTAIFLAKTPFSSTYRPIDKAIEAMVDDGNPVPFFKVVETVLKQNHSNRDELSYGEKHLQTLMIGLLFPYKALMVHSEYEAGREYPDIFLEKVPDRIIKYEVVLELKYLKKKDADKASSLIVDAKNQLASYLQSERFNRPEVLGFWVLFVAGELYEWGQN